MKKSFVIFGLGKFGNSVATELSSAGAEVLAVDCDKERVQALSDVVTCAVCADICDTEAIHSLGISNMDAAVVAITNSLDASILATIHCKESGVPFVFAKAKDDTHAKILQKVGADKTVTPEHESGIRVARHLMTGNILDFIEISKNIRMVEIAVRKEWANHSLRELNLRQKEKMNVIAIRQGENLTVNPNPDEVLTDKSTLLIIVEQKDLRKLLDK
jgi:trk system potassium uptake protein TrkA